MDTSRFSRLAEATRTFLLSRISREAFVFAFFVLLSAGFWLMQTLNEVSEMEVECVLSLEEVPQGTVITSDLPSPIQVVVRDKGTTLINYLLRRKRPTLHVNFPLHDRGGSYGHVVISHSEVQKLLQPELDASTRIVSIRPDTLDYYFNRGGWKRVPVEFVGRVLTDDLSYLVGISLSPDSVTVWGEEHFLDSLSAVYTVATTLNGLTQTMQRKLSVAPLRGAKIEPSEVMLTAEVDMYTEKSVQVPIVGTNFPGGYLLRTFPSSATITFRVGTRDFKNITSDNFVLTATYEELVLQPDSLLHLRLRSVPEGVSQVRIQPESVQFLIEQTEE